MTGIAIAWLRQQFNILRTLGLPLTLYPRDASVHETGFGVTDQDPAAGGGLRGARRTLATRHTAILSSPQLHCELVYSRGVHELVRGGLCQGVSTGDQDIGTQFCWKGRTVD